MNPLGIEIWYRTTSCFSILDGIKAIRSVLKKYRTRSPALVLLNRCQCVLLFCANAVLPLLFLNWSEAQCPPKGCPLSQVFFFCPTTKTINNVFFCLVLSASLIKFFFFAEQLRFQTGGKCSDPGHVFEVCWHVFSNFPDSSFPFFICQFWSLNLFSSNIKNDLDAPPPRSLDSC